MKRGFYLLFIVLLCISCSGESTAESEYIFVLQNGRFLQTDDFTYYKKVNPFPWPVQIRITDMYYTKQTLFLLINHHGIAALTHTADNTFEFSYFYDVNLFDNRTSTIFYPYNNSLICHIYEDDFLRTEEQTSLHPNTTSFIEYTFNGQDLEYTRVITPPWQQLHPEWQAVMVNPLDEQTVAIEWKYTSKDQVKFEYSSFNFANALQKIKTRTWFLTTFEFTSALGHSTDKWYASLFKACIDDLAVHNVDFLVHFNVKSNQNNQIERFIFNTQGYEQNSNSSHFSIPIIKQDDLLCALLPDQKVLAIKQGNSRIQEIMLTPLPTHFEYTNIALFNEFICASWEDIRFTHVGAAGLVVKKLLNE